VGEKAIKENKENHKIYDIEFVRYFGLLNIAASLYFLIVDIFTFRM
jgi:hypothetical protein